MIGPGRVRFEKAGGIVIHCSPKELVYIDREGRERTARAPDGSWDAAFVDKVLAAIADRWASNVKGGQGELGL